MRNNRGKKHKQRCGVCLEVFGGSALSSFPQHTSHHATHERFHSASCGMDAQIYYSRICCKTKIIKTMSLYRQESAAVWKSSRNDGEILAPRPNRPHLVPKESDTPREETHRISRFRSASPDWTSPNHQQVRWDHCQSTPASRETSRYTNVFHTVFPPRLQLEADFSPLSVKFLTQSTQTGIMNYVIYNKTKRFHKHSCDLAVTARALGHVTKHLLHHLCGCGWHQTGSWPWKARCRRHDVSHVVMFDLTFKVKESHLNNQHTADVDYLHIVW